MDDIGHGPQNWWIFDHDYSHLMISQRLLDFTVLLVYISLF